MASVVLNGATSGQITLAPAAVAGTNTATLPAGTGTIIETVTNMAANPVTGTPSSSNYLRGDGTWATVSASGQLIRAPQVLTTGSSYTTPSNCNTIYVEVVGGGGGGGGSNTGAAGGGGGGGYAAKYFSVSPSTAYTYAVGGLGAGAANATGNTGGNSTFIVSGVTITGSGGVGGGGGTGNGGAGGAATNGDVNIKGMAGGASFFTTLNSGNFTFVGSGGNSVLGMGGGSQQNLFASTAIPGLAGTVYGGGGGGGAFASSGGSGAAGLVRIWEYT